MLRKKGVCGALRRSRRGTIAVMFSLSAAVVVSSVGAGIDLMRLYGAQQKLTEIAALVCQYASRPSILEQAVPSLTVLGGITGSLTGYVSKVNGFMQSTWASQNIPTTQTTLNPFSAVTNGAADVAVSTSVPTTFMQIVGVKTIAISAASHCFDSPASITPVTPPASSPYLAQEGFEKAPCSSNWCSVLPNGTIGASATPSSAFPASPSYVGSYGTAWYVTGYCLETDQVGVINGSVPEGSYAAELDCDNGSGSAGNSAISASSYMAAGNYELRYFYRSRVPYPDYDPAYVCGSSAADTSWANDTNDGYWYVGTIGPSAMRTNQINVYLDQPLASGAPPLHTTLNGSQQLAGSAMIDSCVYSSAWVERSVRIKITTPGYYWLTFAADGQNDSYGGQIDNIRLCTGTCPGTPQDNFPSAWLPANNGGVAKILFEDTFESPAYSDTTGFSANASGNLALSAGTSGTAASGWPSLAASGWATAPQNQMIYVMTGAQQGSQYAWMANGAGPNNILTGRPFLLVPGYYNLAYSYTSETIFPALNGVYCGATPAAAGLGALAGIGSGHARLVPSQSAMGALNANTLAAFIANGQLVSTPIGGGALGSTTRYTNPDLNLADTPPATTVSTVATVPPDTISLTGYGVSATSALLDICGYSVPWTARSVNFEISKTGLYWLFFSGRMAGAATWWGGGIDDVRLTALGSPAMLSPPSSYVPVPVGAPQAGSTQTATGYLIVADPLTFPAATQ